ncbi:alcohol dehydrogenase catalytic domain-containing protein [Celeribacter litoreus]|uniref:alcohol dehydrogenase catalytic domain-containing protein n=1 Tax=Celeribacter litoreus TaxID=2876714 RepID=UPI001CCC6357|nr:alcohol dehydrogenase catalytic domain-containing protein [Celeribacter litoreus]MCA0043397.1 alcohol dehydrogenase catalytic domain-containing protein [Celeribacter litoreus]
MAHIHTSIPKTMKAAVMTAKRAPLEVQTVPVPEIGEDEALVKIIASGICRSDWHLWNGDWGWFAELPLPAVLGHEIGAEVVAVGSGVRNVKVGQRVTIPFNLACGHCPYCHTGSQNLCDNLMVPLFVPGGGGWGEYARVPTADMNCIALPDEVDALSAAALGCRYMTAWRAVRDRAHVTAGEFVAVIGCGGVGLAAIEIASAMGGLVIAVDIDDAKLTEAKKNGAIHTISVKGLSPEESVAKIQEVAGGLGPHVSIDALGGSRTALPAVNCLRKGGRFIQVGLTGAEDEGKVNFPADDIVNKEISVIGSLGNPQSTFPELLNMVAAGRLKPGALVSREVNISEVSGVLTEMDNFATSGYVLITSF